MIIEITAQAIGIIAMAFNVLSYQQKKQKYIIAMQFCGSALFATHFFMLGAYMGGILNAVGIFRAVVFLQKDRWKSDRIIWSVGFILIYLASYVLSFTVLGLEFNLKNAILESLPVIGMTATTIAFRCKTAKSTRLFSLISSPSWLIYNIFALSVGAICCEVISIASIFVGLFRYDYKQDKGIGEEENG